MFFMCFFTSTSWHGQCWGYMFSRGI